LEVSTERQCSERSLPAAAVAAAAGTIKGGTKWSTEKGASFCYFLFPFP